MLVNTKAKIGVFSIALGAYLPQFPSWCLISRHSMRISRRRFPIP